MASLANRRSIMDAMRALKPGYGMMFDLPDKMPYRRDQYRMLAGAAHKALGAGNYRVIGVRGGMRKGAISIVRRR